VHTLVIPAYAGIRKGWMVMTDRFAQGAHFHGHDGVLLLTGSSFVEIT